MPGSLELQDRVKAEHPEFVATPCKEISTIEDARGKRSYISLFQHLNKGPDQTRDCRTVQRSDGKF